MERQILTSDSPAWRLQVMVAFGIALGLTTLGIFYLPVDLWTRGYLVIGIYFTVSQSFALAKTLRDQHESARLASQLSDAQAAKMLREYGEA